MIIVRLIGGLGNQLFQYALGRKLARIHNVDIKLDVSQFENYKLRRFCLHNFNIINEHATPEDIRRLQLRFREQANPSVPNPYYRRSYIKEQFYHFDPNILLAPSDAYLEGSWQSQKYFQDIADIIRDDFKVVGHLSEQDLRKAEEIIKSDSIALHIRRGDYITNKHTHSFHGVCSLGYYSHAVKVMAEHVRKPKFFVFSDDIDWVKAKFKIPFPSSYVEHNSAEKDYADLWLMSLCKHQIIANSTFSWWAAWLNANCDKLVIAPTNWFATDTLNDKDIIPDTWLRISEPGAGPDSYQERGMIISGTNSKLSQEAVSAISEIDLPNGAKALFSPKKSFDKKTVLLATSAPPDQTPFSTTEKRPPIGIGYLIAVLRAAGHGVVFIDPYLQPVDYLSTDILQSLNIDFVGIYCNTICFRDTLEKVYRLEEQRMRGVWSGKIMVGGPHVSVRPETLPGFVDFLVQGEGELAILDIVEGRVNDRLVKYPPLRVLDELPRPAWDFFVRLPYNWGGTWLPKGRVFTMNTSRGCPFSCTFCSVCSIWGKRYTFFSAERVVDDIEYVVREFNAQGIYFREDNFTLNRERLVRFCQLLIERNISIPWVCETRVSNLDRELVSLMTRSGAVGFYIGVESGSQRLLDFLKKGISVDQIRNTFAWCREFGIKTAASVIVGVPTETAADVHATQELLQEIKPTVIWFNVFVGIPNSELCDYAFKNDYVQFVDDRGLVYLKGHNERAEAFYGNAWDAKVPITIENGRISNPLVSVVMSVYNGEKHLKQAIQSIMDQGFLNYEFIIVNDASTDATHDILQSLNDPRISILRNSRNIGLTASLNKGIRAARGTYIARMDADDISIPHRFAQQIDYLEKNPATAVVGSAYYVINEEGNVTGIMDVLSDPREIAQDLPRQNWFGHGSVMMRKSCVEEVGGYDERFVYAQDYDLFLRLVERYDLANIATPLYYWRESDHSISSAKKAEQKQFAEMARSAAVDRRSAQCGASSRTPSPTASAPLVSVIVPTFNRPDLLRESVLSVLNQTYPNIEIVVVNDAGSDVRELLEQLNTDGKIRYVSHEHNRGLAAARNSGIAASTGRYIAYLDDDDIYYPDHIRTLVEFLESAPDYQAAYTDAHRIHCESDGAALIETKRDIPYSCEFDYDRILRENFIPVLCVMHRRSCIDTVGPFDELLKRTEDWDLWLRMSRQYSFAHINITTCGFRWRNDAAGMMHGRKEPFQWAALHMFHKYRVYTKDKPDIAAWHATIVRKSLAALLKSVAAEIDKGNQNIHNLLCVASNEQAIQEACALRLYYPEEKQAIELLIDLIASVETCVGNHVTPCAANNVHSLPSSGTKLIAFHLPQYHPIPENDAWWGKGFTEWANVAKAAPLFEGHYQPHLPADLGFYDLRLPEARAAQAELAREYGIHGFCYYHYWFNGKLLLEKPVQEILRSGEPDFPFCLCWANEDWTRSWDGKSGEILMRQDYNLEDDRHHLEYLLPFFRDRRYIRVNGKPLFLVYRASKMPSPKETTRVWREEARKAGIGEIYLCRVESFTSEHTDPTELGFDAAVEFQPDWSRLGKQIQEPSFRDHKVYNYGDVVANMLQKPLSSFKRFPCVTPSWDNSARRRNGATVLNGSTPELYGAWLQDAVRRAPRENPDESIIFINAWNEWAEGNHLEPDQRFGRSYLEATAQALRQAGSAKALPETVEAPDPAVSIIIPVHNNLGLTRQCITTLAANTPGELFEVVIVDNASTDGTGEFLKALGGDVTVITNTGNVGFARACNQGVRAARGKYLVFLNNDTVPREGWLTELVDFMERTPDAGAAGCKLLYPDDTIQHCGAAMRFDFAFFRHPYKFLHRSHPLVNRLRELDAVTAACLITPRETFVRLGMFDEQYLNGCEDMDYCTALRNAGLKIYYVPSSELYHLESRTPRPEDRDRENFRRYADKWGTSVMMNEVELYARDGFWQQEGNRFSPAATAVAKLEELRRSFTPSCPDRNATFAAIAKRIYPVEKWEKAVLPAPFAQDRLPKILFVCHDFPPYRYAGAQLYAMNLARELNRLGVARVDILHPVFREGYDRFEITEAEFEGLKVYRLSKDITIGFENSVRHPVVAELFDGFLAAHDYDGIHVHGLGQLSAVPVEIAAKHGIPVFSTLHDYWLLCPFWHLTTPDQKLCSGPESVEKCADCFARYHSFADEDRSIPERVAEFISFRNEYFRKVFGLMGRVFAPSEFLSRKFARHGFTGIEVSPLGMMPSPIREKEAHDGITFGFAGQIIPRKGIETLLRAFSRIREANVRLLIYGKSDSEAYLQGILAAIDGIPTISYMGGYKPEDLPEIMAQFDVAVVPSHMENYPLVIQEAFMHRVPVIASNAGGIPEVLHHNRNGLLFKVQDESDLEEKIRHIIANPQVLDAFRTNIQPFKTIEDDARFWAGIYGRAGSVLRGPAAAPPARVLFYFFKNVHIPILLPIYLKLKELHPQAEIAFGYMRHAPEIRAGFTPEELCLIEAYGERMYAVPREFSPDITFIADSVYPWVEGCGRLVHVGHGVLSKGQYYTDTDIARREEAADLVCVPGSHHEQVMRNIISKPVVAAGMAKLDGLFSGRIRRESVLERYGLPAGFRYVLFAPTFNDELSAIPFVMDGINRVLTDNDTLLLIKLHGSTKAEYKDMYRDLVRKDPRVVYADELDITPFLALADVMISDVSSSMMEFAALDKPVVLFDNPRWSSYRNYNPDDIEFSWRDIGIRVRSLEEMREAVARSLRYPAEFAERRRFYTDRLFANKLDGSAAERIVSRSFELFGKERASMPL